MHRVPSSAENPYPAGKPPSVKQGKNQNNPLRQATTSTGKLLCKRIMELLTMIGMIIYVTQKISPPVAPTNLIRPVDLTDQQTPFRDPIHQIGGQEDDLQEDDLKKFESFLEKTSRTCKYGPGRPTPKKTVEKSMKTVSKQMVEGSKTKFNPMNLEKLEKALRSASVCSDMYGSLSGGKLEILSGILRHLDIGKGRPRVLEAFAGTCISIGATMRVNRAARVTCVEPQGLRLAFGALIQEAVLPYVKSTQIRFIQGAYEHYTPPFKPTVLIFSAINPLPSKYGLEPPNTRSYLHKAILRTKAKSILEWGKTLEHFLGIVRFYFQSNLIREKYELCGIRIEPPLERVEKEGQGGVSFNGGGDVILFVSKESKSPSPCDEKLKREGHYTLFIYPIGSPNGHWKKHASKK